MEAQNTKATYAGGSLAVRGTVSACSTHSSPRGMVSAPCTQPTFCENILAMLLQPEACGLREHEDVAWGAQGEAQNRSYWL